MGKRSFPDLWLGKLIEKERLERKPWATNLEFYLSIRDLACENELGIHGMEREAFITWGIRGDRWYHMKNRDLNLIWGSSLH